ncbi:hypothetical protein [uncultured Thermanaerothrix sp.]|uniref:hypothetical protein n=1 Tax=uncultured Thermanaerothrix sp. TaxID=1195149 RepID=UPI0026183675|nr:hypothetical protein [uncultured Thermanaerothrix sp.]
MIFFNRRDRVVLAVSLIITGGVVWFLAGVSRSEAMPQLRSVAGGEIGQRGPIVLEFPGKVSEPSVESAWHLEPATQGYFEWRERQLWFWPVTSFEPGQTYSLELRAGWSYADGIRVTQALRFTFRVREPLLLYLGNPNESPEVSSVTLDGQVTQRLTNTSGRVVEFAASPDGESIVFSVRNDQGGIDLGVVNRQGQNQRILVACGQDRCHEPAWTPDGKWITFVRFGADQKGQQSSALWGYDFAKGRAIQLVSAPGLVPTLPTWSPDGNYLAIYDKGALGIRVIGREDRTVAVIPTNVSQSPHWLWDSQRLFFVIEQGDTLLPYRSAYLADLTIQTTRHLFSATQEIWDVSTPAESPDGQWVVVGKRVLNGPVGKQLWLIPMESLDTGEGAIPITTEAIFSTAAYRWEPAGRGLAYQRYDLTSSDAVPQIVIWWRDRLQNQVVAVDGAFPEWLP